MKLSGKTREEFYRTVVANRDLNPTIPLSSFCRKNGISAWSFYRWRKKLLKSLSATTTVAPVVHKSFVPVLFNPPHPSKHAEVVLPNGVLIRFADGIGTQALNDIAGLKWS
jgi:hypothetical protein